MDDWEVEIKTYRGPFVDLLPRQLRILPPAPGKAGETFEVLQKFTGKCSQSFKFFADLLTLPNCCALSLFFGPIIDFDSSQP